MQSLTEHLQPEVIAALGKSARTLDMRKYYGKDQQRLTIEQKMNELYLREDFSSTRFDLRKSMSNTK